MFVYTSPVNTRIKRNESRSKTNPEQKQQNFILQRNHYDKGARKTCVYKKKKKEKINQRNRLVVVMRFFSTFHILSEGFKREREKKK